MKSKSIFYQLIFAGLIIMSLSFITVSSSYSFSLNSLDPQQFPVASQASSMYVNSDWETSTSTSDCLKGWSDTEWTLEIDTTKLVRITVKDCCCPGDFFEIYINREKIGRTIKPTGWGCDIVSPLSSGTYSKVLKEGTYTIKIRDAGFDRHTQEEISAKSMCPAGFTVIGVLLDAGEDCYPQLDTEGLPTLKWPLPGSQSDYYVYGEWGYDWLSSCGGKKTRHTGSDIYTVSGESMLNKEVRAAYDAIAGVHPIIYNAGSGWAYGVTLSHIDQDGYTFTTNYTHIKPNYSILKKDVKKGDLLGTITNIKTSPHLHFSIRRAPYSNTANAGSLPQVNQKNCTCNYKYPDLWPEYFVNPAEATYDE